MQRTTWHNEGTPFGSIGLQGATWIWLPGTGTDTAYKGQCVSGACYHGKPFFLMTCTVYKSLLHLNLSIELSQYVQPPILHGSNESESTTLPPTQFINPFIHMHWWQPTLHSMLALYVRGWLRANSIMGSISRHWVQAQVATDTTRGSARWCLYTLTSLHMNHLEWSSMTVPQASIRAMPRSTATTQERERYGEPCQRTYLWLTATYPSRGGPGGVLATRLDPLSSWSQWMNWKVSWFHYQISTI